MQALLTANPKALEFDLKQRIRETGIRVDTEFLERCITALEYPLQELRRSDPDDIAYDIYRAACVKEFGHGLQDFRKYVHPYEQMASG